MEPTEKKMVVDVFGGILGGILLAVLCGADHEKVLYGSAMFAVSFFSLSAYLLCRFMASPRFILGVSVGLAVVGFWQMQNSPPSGSSHAVMGIGIAIGAMFARYVTAKKSSTA